MNEPPYQCPICKETFESFESFHAHQQEAHNPIEENQASVEAAGGPFPCPECGIELASPSVVEEHLARHHPRREGMG